jgi:hypothetical protein
MAEKTKSALEEQIKSMLADRENHGQMLDDLMTIVREAGSKGVKDQIKKWIADIKYKEGLS